MAVQRISWGFTAALIACWPSFTYGQNVEDIFGSVLRENAEAALAVYGIAAVPSETASTLQLESTSSKYNTFRAGQFGGGFTLDEEFPLYLEGFIGFTRYDPQLIISEGGEESTLPLRWNTVAATGGIGWEFDINENLSILPMAQFSIGRIQSDTSIAAQIVAEKLGLDTNFIDGGGLTVGGVGGSLSLIYNKRWESDYEVDVTFRHTHIHLRPVLDNRNVIASADAITTGFWSRLRIPTGLRLFDRPVRIVTEASGSYLSGDQGRALSTSWLLQGGAGGEIDFSETWVPLISTTRLVARYTHGENLTGFSIGLSASF
ncbi:MAG: autotransporter domain-containing protein [Limibacillus sp.]